MRRYIRFAWLLLSVLPFAAMAGGDGTLASLRWHVRAAAPSAEPAVLTVSWNDGRGRLTVEVPSIAADDPLLAADARYEYALADSVVESGTVPISYARNPEGVSVVIKADAAGAVAEIGDDSRRHLVSIACDLDNPGACDAVCSGGTLLRNDMIVSRRPAPQFSRFTDADSLAAYIAASADSAEGLWRYLDRDMRPERAVPGGYYTLATVADGHGGYEIVYIGGADYNAEAWQPMRLKGRLIPSGFAGNYDLEWTAADGRACPPESYATLDAATGILTLYFPLLNSTMRFRRLAGN